MNKLAIIVDSFTGIEKNEIEKYQHIYYLPLKIIIDNKQYVVGVDKTKQKLMQISNKGKDIKTSQPSPDSISKLFKKLSKEYENVIYLPVSSILSGTFQTAKVLSREIKNVNIVDQILVGDSAIILGLKAIKMMKKNEKNINEIIKWLTKQGNEFNTFIIPKTNKAFIRGGRIGRGTALILEKLNLIPIISFENNKTLHKAAIKKTGKKALTWSIEKMENKIPQIKDEWEWLICHTLDETYLDITKKILKKKGYKNISIQLTNAIINAQTGDGAISIGIRKK